MNKGERIALLQEEMKFEDERQEVLYAEFWRLCDLCPNDLEKMISSDERQELITFSKARERASITILRPSSWRNPGPGGFLSPRPP
jgi:hypothetical protein